MANEQKFRKWHTILIMIMLIDCVTTSAGMLMGLKELNPILNFMYSIAGIMGIVSFSLLMIGMIYIGLPYLLERKGYEKEYKSVAYMCMGLVFVLGIVQVWNLFNIVGGMIL